MTECKNVRQEVEQGSLDKGTTNHLRDCDSCRRYSERLRIASELLRNQHAGFEPDSGFVQRVTTALPGPPQLLGWAAVRLLPAGLALVVLLTGWVWVAAPAATTAMEVAPTDDVLTWVLEEAEETL